jgi:hypothetical protein
MGFGFQIILVDSEDNSYYPTYDVLFSSSIAYGMMRNFEQKYKEKGTIGNSLFVFAQKAFLVPNEYTDSETPSLKNLKKLLRKYSYDESTMKEYNKEFWFVFALLNYEEKEDDEMIRLWITIG